MSEDTETRRSGRPCVFCGTTSRKITKEHVWPKWLRRYIEGADAPKPIKTRRHFMTAEGKTIVSNRWEALPITAQVRDVCHSCNEGWMEQLENVARPYLIPMLDPDEQVELDGIAQHVLAQWATLRVMVAQYMHPLNRRAVPDVSYRRVYETRIPPRGAQVWVGRRNGEGPWPTQYLHTGLHISLSDGLDPELPNGYLSAFSVGYVSFICFGHEIENGPRMQMPGLWPYFRAILPAGPVLKWPLPGLLGATGLEAAVAQFPVS